MQKVLDVLYDKRCMLICEKVPTKSGITMATLKGEGIEVKTSCSVLIPRECFSRADILYLLLPEDFDSRCLKDIAEVELLEIA